MFLKIIIILLAIVAITAGVRTILKREAKFGGDSEDGDGYLVIEGFPAILLGVVEIAIGVYMLIYQRSPTLF